MSARFHPYAHLHPLCRQITVELLRFLTVLQSPPLQFPSLGIHKSNLLEARVVIASYNDHCSAPCLPSLFGWFAPPKFTRVWEPTLSWNQLHSLKLRFYRVNLDVRTSNGDSHTREFPQPLSGLRQKLQRLGDQFLGFLVRV